MEILIVESSVRDVNLFIGALESLRTECSLTVAVSGKAALAVVNKDRLSDKLKMPDLIVISQELPVILSGLDLISTLKQKESLKDTVIVMLTDFNENSGEMQRALELGVDGYFIKPEAGRYQS